MTSRITITRAGSDKRPFEAKADGKVLTSAAGRVSRFATERAARAAARRVCDENDVDAALRAKYAGQPKQPTQSLGRLLTRTFGA